MYVVMSGNGHVGSATAQELLDRGEPVTVVVRDTAAARALRDRGAAVIVADAGDEDALRAAFRAGDRALLVNPPAPVSSDTDAVEHRTADAILGALDGSGLDKVVAVSTYGVQPGERIGDLGTLWRLEHGLREQDIPAAINRHAYAMTNWDGLVGAVRADGMLPSSLPVDLRVPMVDPADLGAAAADRLQSGLDDVGVQYVEGPERYTPGDVAAALADLLGRPVRVGSMPLDDLETAFAGMGFSDVAAVSYAEMTRRTAAGPELPEDVRRGRTTLREHFAALLGR
ncbi:NAD(P)H-binding protein [Curtobacterium pusillum]|uniref:NAD(P)H-binding protein n=2 Tax=Curtobacterium pusillum TaxID=69373 RepID=A0ABX2MCX4_9MICO|nr:NAD(P)H-binding protein [Curtobacterium pusillum]